MNKPLKKLATRASETSGRNSKERRPSSPKSSSYTNNLGRESLNHFNFPTIRVLILLITNLSLAISTDDSGDSMDGDQSRKILGSSVVTSVSVIMDIGNGSKTVYTDSIGRPVDKPSAHAELASPINLLNPDRYEFYTFDDSGNLVRRLMSLEEIKTIIATGDSDGLEFDSMVSESYIPEKKVKDVLDNVQDVLKGEMELHKNKLEINTIFDTPDVSDSWSMILPAVFGNSGADIIPEKPMVHVTPDTIMIETQDNVHTTTKSISSTLNVDNNLTTKSTPSLLVDQIFTTEFSASTKIKEENDMSTIINGMMESSSEIAERKKVTSNDSSIDNTPTQITNSPQLTERQEESSTLTPSSNIYISQNTESIRNTETEIANTDWQTSPLPETNTELTEFTQFSTWTPRLSTVSENEDESMSLSTWRPDLSNNQDLASSTRNPIHSASTTLLVTASTSRRTQSPTSSNEETITPQDILASTNPSITIEIESNKVTEMFTPKVEPSESSTSMPVQLENATKDSQSQIGSNEKFETTTLGSLTTTDMINKIEQSTTDPAFMGSLQELLSQTIQDVGGLVSTINESLPIQNIENKTLIQSMAKLENEIPVVTTSDSDNQVNVSIHSDSVSSTTSIPEESKPLTITRTESTSDTGFYTTIFFEQSTEAIKNQTSKTSEISTSNVESHDKPILLNITILNSKENENDSSNQVQGTNVPSKNTKTEKVSETMSTESAGQEVITTRIDNVIVETSTQAETISKPINIIGITRFPPRNQSGTTPSTVSAEPMEIVQGESSSTEMTNHPSVEIVITETKTNNTNEKTEKLETSLDNVTKLNDSHSNITFGNKFGGTEMDSAVQNESISAQNNSSYESDNQTTEEYNMNNNHTTGVYFNEGILQKETSSKINMSNTMGTTHQNSSQTTETNNIEQSKNETGMITSNPLQSIHESGNHSANKEGNIEDPKKAVIKEVDSSGSDDAWTLVSTITPHPSKPSPQKVQPPQQSYADFIAPSAPIDLKPKPLQGFGLEDSTTSLDIDVYQFTQLCNELAFEFWKTTTSELSPARSVFLSPFGAMSLLAMIFLGARGSTSGEMNEILKLDDMVTFNPHLIFKNVSESVRPEEPDSGLISSAIVRELFSDKLRGKLLPFYKERARAFYDGYVEDINFNEIGDVIRRRTNLQVKKNTKGKIKEFFKDASIIARTPLAAISANIFQTDCAKTSTEGRDGELHFVVLPSIRQRRLVPIPAVVHKSGFLAGYEPSLDATAVSIGTKDQIISTIFVIPGQQGMPAPGDGLARLEKSLVESSFKKGAWPRLLRSLIPREGLEVQIPRIGHRSVINATSALKKMGMRELFDKQKADLSGMNGIPNELFLTDLLQINSFSTCGGVGAGDKHHSEIYPAEASRQRRFLNLDDGDSTFSEGDQTLDSDNLQHDFIDPLYSPRFLDLPLPARPRQARVPDTPRLRFDRPFLYFVRHNPTGLILHIGRFNPRLLP